MTNERRSSEGISMIESILNRLKANERLHPSSPTDDQSDRKIKPESDDQELNLAGRDCSERLRKPDAAGNDEGLGSHAARPDLEEPSPPPLPAKNKQDLQGPVREEAGCDERVEKSESKSSLCSSQESLQSTTNFQKPTASTNIENLLEAQRPPATSDESAASPKTPPLPPKLRKHSNIEITLQRRFTLTDFTLNLEPINLLEEICSGEEWAKYVPPRAAPNNTDARDLSQTETSDRTNDSVYDTTIVKPKLTKNQTCASDKVSQIQQDPSDSSIFAIHKTLLKKHETRKKPAVAECEKLEDYQDLRVYYLFQNNEPTYKKKQVDPPLDFSVVKASEVLDNSALKGRIQLSKKRKHRPPNKKKEVRAQVLPRILMKFPTYRNRSHSTSAERPRIAATSVFYDHPDSSSSAIANLQSPTLEEETKGKRTSC